MKPIEYGNLETDVETLDQALYVASCLCGSSGDHTAYIYGTTHPDFVDGNPGGERYLVFRGDDVSRHHVLKAWTLAYSIKREREG